MTYATEPKRFTLYAAMLRFNRMVYRDPIAQISLGPWQAIALGAWYRLTYHAKHARH